MTLSMKEKNILYAYGCPSHHNTVTRLKWLTALTVDPEAKRRMLGLARKVETEVKDAATTYIVIECISSRRSEEGAPVSKAYRSECM